MCLRVAAETGHQDVPYTISLKRFLATALPNFDLKDLPTGTTVGLNLNLTRGEDGIITISVDKP
jgi:hypothetical protein